MNQMPEKIEKSIKEFINGVNKLFGNRAKRVILYGSYARGDYRENSDIDIMILTDLNDKEINEYGERIWEFAYDIQLENDVLISPLIKNIDKFNNWLDFLPFYMNVQKEGVVLSES